MNIFEAFMQNWDNSQADEETLYVEYDGSKKAKYILNGKEVNRKTLSEKEQDRAWYNNVVRNSSVKKFPKGEDY